MSKYTTLKTAVLTSKIALEVCPITGISISLDVPTIPHHVFTYENPLARIENARGICSLSFQDKQQLRKDVLAGAILSCLSHLCLIADKLSALDRNILLQTCTDYELIELSRLIGTIGRKQAENLPSFSLEVLLLTEEKFSNSSDIVKNYTEQLKSILFPLKEASKGITNMFYSSTYKEEKKKEEKETSLTSADKKEFKSLITALYNQEVIGIKFYSVLNLLSKDNNLLTVDKELKDKIVAKLESLEEKEENQDCVELGKLLDLLAKIEQSRTIEEFFHEENKEFGDAISSSLPSLTVKKTMKEILAERMKK